MNLTTLNIIYYNRKVPYYYISHILSCTGSFLNSFTNSMAKNMKCYFETPGTEANPAK